MLGYLGPSVTNPEYAAIKLLATYLGNGLSSRLFVELREKQGLAYDVSAI
jgi:predicted Zn-dependent peptidase